MDSCALLRRRRAREPVRDLTDRIVPLLEVRWVDEELHLRALRRLLAQDRRGLSLVDCTSLEAMRADATKQVLGLDPHLGEDGARIVPD